MLLEEAIDPGSEDRFRLTPLAWAARGGHAVALELLLKRGVVSDIKSDSY